MVTNAKLDVNYKNTDVMLGLTNGICYLSTFLRGAGDVLSLHCRENLRDG